MAANAVTRALAAARAFQGRPVNAPLGLGFPYQGTHTLGNWESDRAVDVATPVGTPVFAVGAGTIGQQFGPLDSANPRMAGLRLHLNTPEDAYYYAHLSRFAPGIEPGVKVQPGEILGYSGEAAGVPHLHFAEESGLPQHLWSSAQAAATPAPSYSDGTPIQTIRQYAPQQNLDPAAVLAYALTQGGTSWGAVGDRGTSFGPFQAHIGGAAGNRDPSTASSWANSPAGLKQMMAMMARGYTGPRRGPGAAAYIVGPHFGRGLDPASDEAKARAAYPQALKLLGQPPAALAQVEAGPPVVGQPPQRGAAPPQQNVAERIRSGIVTALLAHGGQMNPQTLLNVALNARRSR